MSLDHPTRRGVVRRAVWSVPVIAVVAGAPATAASAESGSLALNYLSSTGSAFTGAGRPTALTTALSVQNVYVTNGPTLTSVSVTVTVPDARIGGSRPTTSGSGWVYSSSIHSGSSWVYGFTWSGTLTSSSSTTDLSVVMTLTSNAAGSFTVAARATAQGASAASMSTTVNL